MWWKTLICIVLISGCGWFKLINPIYELFQYPAWRTIRPEIKDDYYYYLIDEYESIQQNPQFEFLDGYDFINS